MGLFVDRIREITGLVKVTSRLFVIGPTPVPVIGTATAYASGDAFGGKFVLQVPKEGTIATVVFRDYDNEGIAKEIVLFSQEFTATADNSAFAPTDEALKSCVGVISVSTFYAYSANQIGIATPALYFIAPEGRLYGQIVTRGADNIAAGSEPDFTMTVV